MPGYSDKRKLRPSTNQSIQDLADQDQDSRRSIFAKMILDVAIEAVAKEYIVSKERAESLLKKAFEQSER
jgi:hypothetical protein